MVTFDDSAGLEIEALVLKHGPEKILDVLTHTLFASIEAKECGSEWGLSEPVKVQGIYYEALSEAHKSIERTLQAKGWDE